MLKQKKTMMLLTLLLSISMGRSVHAADIPILLSGDNVLAAVNHNERFASSDMTLIIKLEGDGEIFVDEGHPIKYIVPDQNIKGWFEPKFKDAKWEDGISGVGFADEDDNTVVKGGILSIHTRYHFEVKDALQVKQLMLYVDYDDGYAAWLNGVEISRSISMVRAGDPPKWDAGSRGHGSSEQPKGQPNPNRWAHKDIEKKAIAFAVKGGLAVAAGDKLATVWARMKESY